jgi:hypothetical protein
MYMTPRSAEQEGVVVADSVMVMFSTLAEPNDIQGST